MQKEKKQEKKATIKKIKSDKNTISKIVMEYRAGIVCDTFGWYNH